MNKRLMRKEAHAEVDHIFRDLLPRNGMAYREEQVRLSHKMLDAMMNNNIALCDAGTGIGKTYAYLVAGIVYDHFRTSNGLIIQPLVISTSSIALQNAVKREYLPLLSATLLEDGIIHQPVMAVIRKGKAHYVCDQRLQRRLHQLEESDRNKRTMQALGSLMEKLDLDDIPHLGDYERRQIHVPERCNCDRDYCRYRDHMKQCDSIRYLFQICNHNLLIADAIHRTSGKPPIFPDYCALVMDESHKLPDVAREMFGLTLSVEDLQSIIYGLKMERYVLAAEYLTEATVALRKLLLNPPEERDFQDYTDAMETPYRVLLTVRRKLCRNVSPRLGRNLDNLVTTLEAFLHADESDQVVCYTTESDTGNALLCLSVFDLTERMKETMWVNPRAMVLTSGTLAVGDNFDRFREEVGLVYNGRVKESVSLSPFRYDKNCLMYLPKYPPHQFGSREDYYFDALADEIARLLDATCGHALVLFTSYSDMAAVEERLSSMGLIYPIFTLGKNAAHTLEEFKATPGAVLLATGSAWEGMDFPGDCVSLLVIPKLPFAYPDALGEKQKEQFPTLTDFIHSIVVPDMQIKLRQGFGRAIRTENDTCVVAILDERACHRGRYKAAVKEALPKMPTTDDLDRVQEFILDHKPDRYFREICTCK